MSLFTPVLQCFTSEKLNAQENKLRAVYPFSWQEAMQGQLYNWVDCIELDGHYYSLSIPWHTNFSSFASVTVVLLSDLFFSVRRWLRLFFVSPHRFDPPCMLGMFRMAIPSREILIKSSWIPSHWLAWKKERGGGREGEKKKKKKREKKSSKRERKIRMFYQSDILLQQFISVNGLFNVYT